MKENCPAALMAFLMLFWLPTARAQTFTVLHTFHGPDGAGPAGGVILDGSGTIYGTTEAGGRGNTCPNFSSDGCGTVFVLSRSGKEVALYSFRGPDGAGPTGGLLRVANGNVFGATRAGGVLGQPCGGTQGSGCGVAFRLSPTGTELEYSFRGTPDGFYPGGPLAEDQMGNFYGTTELGGPNGLGAVFKIDPAGRETILYSFTGGTDGCLAGTGVVLDSVGNLYGVADQGGAGFCEYGYGIVFKIDASGQFSVIHTFVGGDGAYPESALTLDPQGNVYGVTGGGGDSPECAYLGGCGTVFELSPETGGVWSEKVLYSFCSVMECADGLGPNGPLAIDSAGNFYGTTYFGGGNTFLCKSGCGVVFKLVPNGDESVLHSFTDGTDGGYPSAGVTLDATGNLYGVTQQGGDAQCPFKGGCGVVFRVSPRQ